MLRKIKLDSHQLNMSDEHKGIYWDPVVRMVMNLKNSSPNEDLKKAQFLQYRRDILTVLNKAFSSKPSNKVEIKKQAFYVDLLDMGIDMSIIYEAGTNLDKKLQKTAEQDYNAWKNGGYRG
jgi:hypothetical protein